jgi:hypothetical protein
MSRIVEKFVLILAARLSPKVPLICARDYRIMNGIPFGNASVPLPSMHRTLIATLRLIGVHFSTPEFRK